MLYTPPLFNVDDHEEIYADLQRAGIGMLVTSSAEGPMISHIPMVLDRSRGAQSVLAGHIAKANPHWQKSDLSMPAVAVFNGPDAYVTPSWYPSKQEHGRVVPSWNYTTIHARGSIRFIEDSDWLRTNVSQLTDKFEASRSDPWAVSDAPDRFIDMQLKAIVGFEIEITLLQGKRKISQNREDADREGVVEGLAAERTASGDAMSKLVKAAMETKRATHS